MSAVINTKTKAMPSKYVRRAAELIRGAATDYFKETTPVMQGSVSEIKSSANEIASTLASTTQNILPKLRQIRSQPGFRSISDWFLGAESEYEDDEAAGLLSFDTGSGVEVDDDSDSAQISESFNKAANQVSKSVIESSHQLAETQILSTANITKSIDNQTAVIKSGFESTVSAIEKLTEIVTKNTAALIETNVVAASSKEEDFNKNLLSSKKFNLRDFRKMVGANLENSELGTVATIIGGLLESPERIAELLSSDTLIRGGLKMAFDKAAPKLKQNLAALDDVLNETIMSSLMRLGEKRDASTRGIAGRILGINAMREDTGTGRAELDVKSTPYDTISKEALTGAIPGYLRQLVILAGGPDMVYDYRSRSFKTKKAINREFNEATAIRGGLAGSSADMRKSITNNSFNQMMYDLMLNDLGSNQYAGAHRDIIDSIRDNLEEAKKYARSLIGNEYGEDALKAAELYATQLHRGLNTSGAASTRLGNQVSYATHQRNVAANQYVSRANLYDMDISDADTSAAADANAIKRMYGLKKSESAVIADGTGTYAGRSTAGISYANKALYEIYNRLETGINVFQVGKSTKPRKSKFEMLNALEAPDGYRPKPGSGDSGDESTSNIVTTALNSADTDGANLLRNNQLDDGTTENLSGGSRLSRWGSKRGGDVMKALFNGSPEQVRDAFGAAISDLADIAGDSIKDGAAKLDKSFGNISGMIKHKLFGTEYSYEDGDEIIHVKENKGVLGFIGDEFKDMFDKAKKSGSDWMKTVKGYFNYGDSDEDEGVVSRRKKILGAAIGAFAGAGLLGGPIGLLVGNIVGGAIVTSSIGKKLNKLLFGHDDEGEDATGKPTGIISKAVDAVTSPIEFQLQKTMAVSGAALQKHIFGPMSDIGYALKDRMLNRVDSFFQPLKDEIKKAAGNLVGWVGKKAASIVTGIATAATRVQSTVVGKAARGAINLIGGAIGAGQIFTANRVSSRSYHRLRGDETYPLQIGEKYYDPRLENLGANDPARVRKLQEDAVLPDGSPDEFIRNRIQVLEDLPPDMLGRHPRGILLDAKRGAKELRPSTKNFLKWRRKERNAEINKNLASKGFKGGIGGFFGSEYKNWRKNKWSDGIARRERFAAATAEMRKTPEEIAEEQNRQSASEHAETQASLDQITKEIIPGSSFKTHDQGIHDRLDIIIKHLTGSDYNDTGGADVNGDAIVKQKLKDEKESAARLAAEERKENFANSALATAGSIAATGGLDDEDERTFNAIVNEAQKDNSNDNTISKKLNELLSGNKGDDEEDEGEEKESIFSKILNGILDHPMLAGAAVAIPALLSFLQGMDIDGLKFAIDTAGNIIQWGANIFSSVWDAVQKLLGLKDSDQDATEHGMNISLAKYGVQVEKKTDLGALGTLKHLSKNGAGDYIDNSAATTVKNDVTWLGALRSDISTKAFAGLQSESLLNQAARLDTQATQLRQQGGIINNWRADRKSAKAEKLLDQGQVVQQNAAQLSPGANLATNVARSYGRVGIIDLAGKGAGLISGLGAKAFGASDEGAQVISNIGNAVVSGGLTADLAHKSLHNAWHPNSTKKALVDKILDGVIYIIEFLMEKVGADKAVSKLVTSKPVETVASLCTKVTNALKNKIDDLVIKKLEAGLAKLGVDNALAVATAGLVVGAGAIAGGIDGWCKTNHLFGVRPGDETAGMRAISTALSAALGAVSMTPFGWVCIILDVIDAILVKVLGRGLTQMVAQTIYSMCGGGAELAEKQAAMEADRIHANETYGTNLTVDAHNDEVNSSGFFDRLINGKATVGDDDFVIRDEAGAVLKQGGALNLMFGNEREYMHNEDGSVMRRSDGTAVIATDKYGRELKKNSKWGDSLGNILGNAKRFIFGGDVYETDESGVSLVDENGNKVKGEREKSIIGKSGDALNAAGKFISDSASAAGEAIGTGWNNLKEGGAALINGAGDLLNSLNPFAKKNKDEPIKDSKGADVRDADGKKVSTGSIGKAASGIIGSLTGSIGAIINDVKKATDDTDENSTVSDEKGKAVIAFDSNSKKIKRSEIGDFIKNGITKITARITDPLRQMSEGVDEWEKKEAPWKNEKGSGNSVISWISKTVGSFWDKIKTGVDSLNSSVSGAVNGATVGVTTSNPFLKKLGVGGPVANTIDGGGNTLASSLMGSLSGVVAGTNTQMPGGNPLNKEFGISSGYGYRNLAGSGEFHSGVDLYPTDGSKSADVGARFNGEVISYRDDLPDSHTGLNVKTDTAGNYIKYRTDSGLVIKNFHLKHNSIPSEMKKAGAKVTIGQKLGMMGSTGRSTGPHLHYQIESDGASLDPNKVRSIDPTDNVKNGATLSSFSSSSTDGDSNWLQDSIASSSNADGEGSTDFSNLIEALSKIGNDALSMVFGGLISGDISNASSLITGGSGYEQFLNYSGNVKSVDDFLSLCAKEIGTKDNGNNRVKYNDWFWGKGTEGPKYPWCMAFVQWCFNQAGLDLPIKTAGCGSLCEYYEKNDPSKIVSTPKPGDLIIFQFKEPHDHVGIVKSVSGTTYTTIEGNTSGTVNGSQWNGGVVAQKTRYKNQVYCFIRAIDFDALKVAVANKGKAGDGAEALWAYLKGLGYNDIAIAGILGCWKKESDLTAKRIEGDHLASFPGYDALINSQTAMDNWTRNGLGKNETKNPGYFIGGHAYPGVGLAQWTKGRNKALMDFAKQNNGKWYDPSIQLSYFQEELKNNYYKKVRPESLNSVGSVEAATKQFCSIYEGYNGATGISQRQTEARDLYNKYAGKFGVGGPTDEESAKIDIADMRRMEGEIDEGQINAHNRNGKGGPIGGSEINSEIHPRKPRRAPKPVGGPVSEITYPNYHRRNDTSKEVVNSTPAAITHPQSADSSWIAPLMERMITYLENISRNTGESNDLLSDIKDKETSTQVSSTSSANRTRTSSSKLGAIRPTSSGNTRLISGMVRP